MVAKGEWGGRGIGSLGLVDANYYIYFFSFNDFHFFSIIADVQCSVNFLLYSKVTQSHIHIYILFFF